MQGFLSSVQPISWTHLSVPGGRSARVTRHHSTQNCFCGADTSLSLCLSVVKVQSRGGYLAVEGNTPSEASCRLLLRTDTWVGPCFGIELQLPGTQCQLRPSLLLWELTQARQVRFLPPNAGGERLPRQGSCKL